MKRKRSPEREAVVLRAREWRALRDERLFATAEMAERLGVTSERMTAILCASVGTLPTAAEVAAIDKLLG